MVLQWEGPVQRHIVFVVEAVELEQISLTSLLTPCQCNSINVTQSFLYHSSYTTLATDIVVTNDTLIHSLIHSLFVPSHLQLFSTYLTPCNFLTCSLHSFYSLFACSTFILFIGILSLLLHHFSHASSLYFPHLLLNFCLKFTTFSYRCPRPGA